MLISPIGALRMRQLHDALATCACFVVGNAPKPYSIDYRIHAEAAARTACIAVGGAYSLDVTDGRFLGCASLFLCLFMRLCAKVCCTDRTWNKHYSRCASISISDVLF